MAFQAFHPIVKVCHRGYLCDLGRAPEHEHGHRTSPNAKSAASYITNRLRAALMLLDVAEFLLIFDARSESNRYLIRAIVKKTEEEIGKKFYRRELCVIYSEGKVVKVKNFLSGRNWEGLFCFSKEDPSMMRRAANKEGGGGTTASLVYIDCVIPNPKDVPQCQNCEHTQHMWNG